MRIGALVGKVAEDIDEQAEHEFEMGGHVDECDYDIGYDVDGGDDEHRH